MDNEETYDVTEEQWKRIQPLLPPEKTGKKGRPGNDNRKMLKSSNGGEKTENKAVGRTKGGLNTKIYAIVDGLGNPVVFFLSPGNDNDSTHAIELMSMTDIAGSNLLGDKAYGTKEILTYIKEHEVAVVIPPKSNAKEPWTIDYFLYKERHLVECFF